MPFCKRCGISINGKYKYCLDCNDQVASERGQLMRMGRKVEVRLKAAADASGNPRIWTSKDYSQEFLRGLIGEKL